jgi:Tfp pilus assembly protein PilF
MSWRLCSVFLAVLISQPGCLFMQLSTDTKPIEPDRLQNKESATLCVSVADSLVTRGHHKEAIGQLQLARRFDSGLDVSVKLARLHAKLGNDTEALNEFDLALKARPTDAALWNDIGYYQYERGNWVEAEKALRKAVEIDGKLTRGWINLGMTLGQKGEYPQSLEAFEQAVRPAEARCNLAFIAMTQGKKEEARALYQEAAQLDPGLKAARAGLARLDAPNKLPQTPTPAQSLPSTPSQAATSGQQTPNIQPVSFSQPTPR